MGAHLRVLRESYPINTSMTGFRNLCILVLWTKVALALEGLRSCTMYKLDRNCVQNRGCSLEFSLEFPPQEIYVLVYDNGSLLKHGLSRGFYTIHAYILIHGNEGDIAPK